MTETPTSEPRRRRPLLIAGALAAAALLAGTVALVAGGDDDGPPRLDLDTAAAGGGAERLAESALADEDMAAGSSMAAWTNYVAGEELEDMGGSAPVYRLVAGDDDLRRIAEHLGVEGEVTAAEGNQRSITQGDASINGHGASWWYTSGRTYPGSEGPDSSVASACASPDGEPVECEDTAPAPEPERPADLPTQDEAEQIVRELAAAAGLDLTDARVTTFDNVVTWSVNIDLALDGTPVVGWSVYGTVMEGGQILDAGGSMGRTEEVGVYPLDTTRVAIDRLNEQQGGGTQTEPGGIEPAPMPAEGESGIEGGSTGAGSSGSAGSVEPGSEGDLAEPDPGTAEEPASDPAAEPEPAPDEMTIMPVDEGGEPITVTLRSAERSYTMVGNSDGTESYLVPVYLLDGEDDRGEQWTDVFALALPAEFLGV